MHPTIISDQWVEAVKPVLYAYSFFLSDVQVLLIDCETQMEVEPCSVFELVFSGHEDVRIVYNVLFYLLY